MPTPRKPNAVLQASGRLRENPSRARVDIQAADGEIGAWHVGSADPRDIWDEIVSGAPKKVLTASDRVAVEAAVWLIARMRLNPASVSPALITSLFAALGKLGM